MNAPAFPDPSTHVYPLVLLGGGHSHALWLKYWQQLENSLPAKQIRPLLISDNTTSPYSGMLPGLLSGDYSYDDCHIDLVRLSEKSHCDFLQRRCINIQRVDDLELEDLYRLDFAPLDSEQLISEELKNHNPAPIFCRILSINIGSQPFVSTEEINQLPNSKSWKVKPINQFFQNWQSLQKSLARPSLELSQKSLIKIMGAGAAGVEIACAIKQSQPNSQVQLHSRSAMPLPHFNAKSQGRCLEYLKKLDIEFIRSYQHPSTATSSNCNIDNDFDIDRRDFTIWCTQSAAARWLTNTDLKLSQEGFIWVDQYLQTSLPNVFAAGDCLHFSPQPLPKAGVYAVRQATTLFENICLCLTKSDKPTRVSFKPQKSILSIINMGNHYALAQKGRWSTHGYLPWIYKHYIDSKFMAQFK
jgi:selenide,water dikinase